MGLDDAIKQAMGITLTDEVRKALVTGDAGDFIPEEYANEFIDLVRERNWIRYKRFTETNYWQTNF